MKSNFTKLITVLLFCSLSLVKAQNIGINGTGANPNASALLDIDDAGTNNKGLLIPRIPLTAINAAAPVTSPATSLLVYNTASASTGTNAVSPGYYYWDGTKWVRFSYNASGSSANDWNLLGNAGTNPATNFLGTTDAQDLVFRTNNLEAVRVTTAGNVGIGTISPIHALHVKRNDGNSRIVIERTDNTAGGTLVLEQSGGNTSAGLHHGSIDGYAQVSGTRQWTTRIAFNTKTANTKEGEIVFHTSDGIAGSPPERMRITSTGSVGIGIATPSANLHVYDASGFAGTVVPLRAAIWADIPAQSSNGYSLFKGTGGTTFNPGVVYGLNLDLNPSGTSSGTQYGVYVNNETKNYFSNNVGIGTTNPLVKLQVEGASNNLMNLVNTSSSINLPAWQNYIQFGDGTLNAGYVGEGSNGKLMSLVGHYAHGVTLASFQSNIATSLNCKIDLLPGGNSSIVFNTKLNDRMIIDSVGDIGIGTVAPLSQLHIVGVGTSVYNNGLTVQSPNATQALDVMPGFALTNSTAAGIQEDLTMTLRSSGSFAGNMAFATGNEERMRLLANGNLGIGTTAPTQKLHVKEGYILLDNTTVPESALILSNNNTGLNSNASIQFRNQAGNVWTNYMGGPTGYAGVDPNALEWWEYPFSQMSNSGTCCLTRFKIQPNNTGVGYATVVIDGSGQMYGNGWAQPSDRTLKKNIKPLTNALDKISKLGGYSYNFTKESNLDDGKVHIGVIAQEVEAVLPEAVSQFPNASYKAINYDALIPLQIEAIKELREENIKQQELISELLKRIETLEKK